jgi:hypothetical protein
LVGLYEEPERPPNAVEYVRKYMGAAAGVDVDALKAENERLKNQVAEIRGRLEDAHQKVWSHLLSSFYPCSFPSLHFLCVVFSLLLVFAVSCCWN